MDPTLNTAAAAALGAGQAWLLAASMFGTLITTIAMLWKTSHDQRHQLELIKLQHQIDREERESSARQLAGSVTSAAADVRDRLEATAHRLQERVEITARDVRDRVDTTAKEARERLDTGVSAVSTNATTALDAQTEDLARIIDAAKTFTADKAEQAYHEANSVNVKLQKLHEAHDRQGRVLEQLLNAVRAGGPVAAPPAAGALDVVAVPSGPGALAVVAVPAGGPDAPSLPPPGAGAAAVAE